MRKLTFLGMFFVSQLFFVSPAADAASVKVDVCHRDDTGSFQLINISDKAVPAHRRHGDALPFEGVPGAPGNTFDEFCTFMAASTCPCDFSASGLAEVAIDGVADGRVEEVCFEVGGPPGVSVQQPTTTGFSFLGAAQVEPGFGTGTCLRVWEDGVLELDDIGTLTVEQIADCAFDLRQTDACLD